MTSKKDILIRNKKFKVYKNLRTNLLHEFKPLKHIMAFGKLENLYNQLIKQQPLTLGQAAELSQQAQKACSFINEVKIELKTYKYNEIENKRLYEFESLRYAFEYLTKRGEPVDQMIFFAYDEPLGYDGELQISSKKVQIETTRAVGKNGGQRERLVKEMLAKYGAAPEGQEIQYSGNEHKRKIDLEKNRVKVISNPATFGSQVIELHNPPPQKEYWDFTKDGLHYIRYPCGGYNVKKTIEPDSHYLTQEQINWIEEMHQKNSYAFTKAPSAEFKANNINIPNRLKEAFFLKNDCKYKEYWLIISIPLYCHDTEFYNGCNAFWESINRYSGVFNRVLIVCEDHIKQGIIKDNSVWDSSCN